MPYEPFSGCESAYSTESVDGKLSHNPPYRAVMLISYNFTLVRRVSPVSSWGVPEELDFLTIADILCSLLDFESGFFDGVPGWHTADFAGLS